MANSSKAVNDNLPCMLTKKKYVNLQLKKNKSTKVHTKNSLYTLTIYTCNYIY